MNLLDIVGERVKPSRKKLEGLRRALAVKVHPDKVGGSNQAMVDLYRAVEVVSEANHKQYDRVRAVLTINFEFPTPDEVNNGSFGYKTGRGLFKQQKLALNILREVHALNPLSIQRVKAAYEDLIKPSSDGDPVVRDGESRRAWLKRHGIVASLKSFEIDPAQAEKLNKRAKIQAFVKEQVRELFSSVNMEPMEIDDRERIRFEIALRDNVLEHGFKKVYADVKKRNDTKFGRKLAFVLHGLALELLEMRGRVRSKLGHMATVRLDESREIKARHSEKSIARARDDKEFFLKYDSSNFDSARNEPFDEVVHREASRSAEEQITLELLNVPKDRLSKKLELLEGHEDLIAVASIQRPQILKEAFAVALDTNELFNQVRLQHFKETGAYSIAAADESLKAALVGVELPKFMLSVKNKAVMLRLTAQACINEQLNGLQGSYTNTDDHPKPKRCFNCFQLGHSANECENPVVCKKCKQPGHRAVDCAIVSSCQQSFADEGVFNISTDGVFYEQSITGVSSETSVGLEEHAVLGSEWVEDLPSYPNETDTSVCRRKYEDHIYDCGMDCCEVASNNEFSDASVETSSVESSKLYSQQEFSDKVQKSDFELKNCYGYVCKANNPHSIGNLNLESKAVQSWCAGAPRLYPEESQLDQRPNAKFFFAVSAIILLPVIVYCAVRFHHVSEFMQVFPPCMCVLIWSLFGFGSRVHLIRTDPNVKRGFFLKLYGTLCGALWWTFVYQRPSKWFDGDIEYLRMSHVFSEKFDKLVFDKGDVVVQKRDKALTEIHRVLVEDVELREREVDVRPASMHKVALESNPRFKYVCEEVIFKDLHRAKYSFGWPKLSPYQVVVTSKREKVFITHLCHALRKSTSGAISSLQSAYEMTMRALNRTYSVNVTNDEHVHNNGGVLVRAVINAHLSQCMSTGKPENVEPVRDKSSL